MKQTQRIDILDAFRCLAILGVISFHFYACWTTPRLAVNYYPYGSVLAPYFKYGYYGVQLFFIISGFVIFYTLEKSLHWADFVIKRFTRLFPAMLIFSVMTYFFVEVADSAYKFPPIHPKTALSFLPSLTFTPPVIWAKLFKNNSIYYVSSAYWSLWVEVCFYAVSSVIFFVNKQKFVRNWMLLLIPCTIIRVIGNTAFQLSTGNAVLDGVMNIFKKIDTYCKFCDYILYFSLGILFNCLFFQKKIPRSSIALCVFFCMLEFFLLDAGIIPRLLFAGFLILFLLLIYKPGYLRFLNNRLIMRIGVISYGLYLINENVGLIMITKLSTFTSSPFITAIVPVFVLLMIITFCELVYRYYEKPVNNWFRKIWLRHGRNTGRELQPK